MSVTRDAYGRIVASIQPVYQYPTECRHCRGTELLPLNNHVGCPRLCSRCSGVTPAQLVRYEERRHRPREPRLEGDVDTFGPQAPVESSNLHPM